MRLAETARFSYRVGNALRARVRRNFSFYDLSTGFGELGIFELWDMVFGSLSWALGADCFPHEFPGGGCFPRKFGQDCGWRLLRESQPRRQGKMF